MVARKQTERKRLKTRYIPQGHIPMDYFLQLVPNFKFPPLPNNGIKSRIDQWINPFMRSEPS
jgi:hypothetical protein